MQRRFLGTLGAGLWLLSSAAAPADTERGAALYDNHCTACHTSRAHIREQRKAGNLDEVREWVRRWQKTQSLGWSATDVEDVAAYLNARFYRFEPVARQ